MYTSLPHLHSERGLQTWPSYSKNRLLLGKAESKTISSRTKMSENLSAERRQREKGDHRIIKVGKNL